MLTLVQRGFIVTLLFFCLTLSAQVESQWRHGIIRVNTDISAGAEKCEEVAQLARNANIDFIVFSDQFLVRAEYGIPPLRNFLKYSISQKSIISFGIDKYLARIKQANEKYPDMVLIPGADIAPHYYWTGRPFSKDFTANQFSEQLTVFGSSSPEFYRNFPVIHNERSVFSFTSCLKSLPLLFVLLGLWLFVLRKKGGYTDAQGNSYDHRAKKVRMYIAFLLIIVGLAWTMENRPFVEPLKYDQYNDYNTTPYQFVIDYIRQYEKENAEKCALFWSAPEAKMEDNLFGVKLLSRPYLEDILETKGHNGFAAIYGDAVTAHKPGHEWDKLLLEYCEGKRKVKPVIIGELDYHGKGKKIDLIQTVVAVNTFNADSIVNAIRTGKSYAYANTGTHKLIIEEICLKNKDKSAGMGTSLDIIEGEEVLFSLKGHIEGVNSKNTKITVTVIVNEKIKDVIRITGDHFDIKLPLEFTKWTNAKGYVRFLLETNHSGTVFSNPVFVNVKKNNIL